MIVDMMRNDLGRIAEPGSVKVDELFKVETYPTVHQLTSTVSARTRGSYSQVLRALFPSASITGAPKIATSRIIRRARGRTSRGLHRFDRLSGAGPAGAAQCGDPDGDG